MIQLLQDQMKTEGLSFLVEHLPRIGTTSIDICAVGQPVIVSRGPGKLCVEDTEENKATILLPCEEFVGEQAKFTTVSPGCYRLRLKSREEVVNAFNCNNKARNVFMSLPEGKWSKKELIESKGFRILCLTCRTDIINEQNCFKINEMPSEFWMELMDYWHCHKPHDISKENEYSVRYNSLKPLKGEILLGSAFFLAQQDTFAGRVKTENGRGNARSFVQNLQMASFTEKIQQGGRYLSPRARCSFHIVKSDQRLLNTLRSFGI